MAGALILAFIDASRGLSYFPVSMNVPPVPPHWFERLFTYPVWGGIWIAVAVICFAAAFYRPAIPVAVGLTMALHGASAAAVLAGWVMQEVPGGWSLALPYASISVLILWAWSRGRSGAIRVSRLRG